MFKERVSFFVFTLQRQLAQTEHLNGNFITQSFGLNLEAEEAVNEKNRS
jgi:hypothetical protein